MAKNPYEKDAEAENDGFFDGEGTEESVQEEKEERLKPKNPYMGGAFEKKTSQKEEKKGNPYVLQKNENDEGRYQTSAKNKGKAGKIVLCILLSVVLFLSGGITGWFLLGEETRSFLKVKFLIENLYYEEVDEEDIYDIVFDAINNNLLDPYSQYYTADEYEAVKEQSKGARSGIGVSFIRENKDGVERLKVVIVSGNSPAEEAGVTVGSYLTGFGESASTIQACMDFEQFAAFLAEYDSGELFYIQLEEEQTTKILPMYKAEFIESYVFYRTQNTAYGFTGDTATTLTEKGAALTSLNADTAYIRLTQFNGGASEQFDKVMQQFKKDNKKHLVLDLRNNGGGSVDILCDIAKYFCKDSKSKRPLVTKSEYRDYDEKYYASKNVYHEYFDVDSKIYVLADNGTASASEALMGCMLDYNSISYQDICLSYRASTSVAGGREAKTFGKGIMQMTMPLLFGSDALKLTVARIVWPTSDNCIHGRGILPEDGAKTVQEYSNDDEEIRQAIDVLTK